MKAFPQNVIIIQQILTEMKYLSLESRGHLWMCAETTGRFTRAQNAWHGWPVYELKCLCFRGRE